MRTYGGIKKSEEQRKKLHSLSISEEQDIDSDDLLFYIKHFTS